MAELKQIQMRCTVVIADPKKDQDTLMTPKYLNVKLGHAKRIDSLMAGLLRARSVQNLRGGREARPNFGRTVDLQSRRA